ncbi:MAG: serine hydrolase domain-containing protein [Betaproteobacteria bacterium]
MDARLSQADSEVDFSFAVERQDGRRYTFNRGASTMQTHYASASTSKLVAAVIILRLVEQGYLTLAQKPQELIQSWPISSSDPLSGMTLAQLLSLTSGLASDSPCLDSVSIDFEACVDNLATTNAGRGKIPGQEFFYSDAHLQVAGLMAVKARGVAGWQNVFSEFKMQTGLFAASTFDLPSAGNPRIAGGMNMTGGDYMDFLKALKNGALLSAASMGQLLADQTASIPIAYSPIFEGINGGPGLGEDWHYGFGLWQECQSATYNCVPGTRVSSPGSYGAYPFWDRSKNYTGIVLRQGANNTLIKGITIERAVRSDVEQWAACS